MKNRTTKDERVMQVNGTKSLSRELIVEALETVTSEGATVDEIVDLIGKDLPSENKKMSVGGTLSRMETDNYVVNYRGKWYLKEHLVKNIPEQQQVNPPATNGFFAKIAAVVQKRSAKSVSLYRMPTIYTDAIGVSLLINQHWTPVPLFGNLRICIDKEIPNWSPDRIWYSDVEIVRITRQNGQVSEERPAPKDYVTIDQEE